MRLSIHSSIYSTFGRPVTLREKKSISLLLSEEKKTHSPPSLLAAPSRDQPVRRIMGNYFEISISFRFVPFTVN